MIAMLELAAPAALILAAIGLTTATVGLIADCLYRKSENS